MPHDHEDVGMAHAHKKGERDVLVIEINPRDAKEHPHQIEAAVQNLTLKGVKWLPGFKVEEVAFGIKKVVAQCVIEDPSVNVADVTEAIQALHNHHKEPLVGDVEVRAFGKAPF